jgi:PAS domain S-box-containing protein
LLLVDDKASNLVVLEAILGDEYELLLAYSGQEAVDIIEKNEVAVILLDVQMPGMDGFETARRIKTMEQRRHIPIIFITAIFTENPFVRQGYEAGAVDYFAKPFDPDILKIKIGIYASMQQKITLLKERERRIEETEELMQAGRKLSAVLETLPVGVLIADSNGYIRQTNEETMRIWNSIEPAKNDSYGQFLEWWNEDGHLIKTALAQVLKTGEAIHNQSLVIKCFDGMLKTVINSISPLRGLSDEIVGLVVVLQDITEHKRIGQDIEQRIAKLISLGVEFEQSARASA